MAGDTLCRMAHPPKPKADRGTEEEDCNFLGSQAKRGLMGVQKEEGKEGRGRSQREEVKGGQTGIHGSKG